MTEIMHYFNLPHSSFSFHEPLYIFFNND